MSEGSWREEIVPMVRTSQIIVGALITGVLVFFTIASVLVVQGTFNGEGPGDDSMLFVMNVTLVLFLSGAMLARGIVPGIIVAQARRKIATGQWNAPTPPSGVSPVGPFLERTGDAGRLMIVFQTRTIVAAALLEGLAFFATIVFMITQSMIGLMVAIVMIIGLMLHFPTRSGVTHWIEEQLALIEQERALHPE